MATKNKVTVESEVRFTKEQLVESKTYADVRPLIRAILKDGEKYTKAEVEILLNNYLKRKVN